MNNINSDIYYKEMKNINYKVGDRVKYHSCWVNGTGYTFFEGEINNIINESEHIYEVKRLDDGSLLKVTDCDEQEEYKKIGDKLGHVTFLELIDDNKNGKVKN